MICSKCGKSFTEPPAMSRADDSAICSLCASKEAMEAAGWSKEKQIEAVELIKKMEEKRCGGRTT